MYEEPCKMKIANAKKVVTKSRRLVARAVMVLCQDRKDRSFFWDQGLVLLVKEGLVLEWSSNLAYISLNIA